MFFAVALLVITVAFAVEGVALFLRGHFLEEESHLIRLFRIALLAPDEVSEKDADSKDHAHHEANEKQGRGTVRPDERPLAHPEVGHRLLVHFYETIDHDEGEDEGPDH
jgi:hypothetical protein